MSLLPGSDRQFPLRVFSRRAVTPEEMRYRDLAEIYSSNSNATKITHATRMIDNSNAHENTIHDLKELQFQRNNHTSRKSEFATQTIIIPMCASHDSELCAITLSAQRGNHNPRFEIPNTLLAVIEIRDSQEHFTRKRHAVREL